MLHEISKKRSCQSSLGQVLWASSDWGRGSGRTFEGEAGAIDQEVESYLGQRWEGGESCCRDGQNKDSIVPG